MLLLDFGADQLAERDVFVIRGELLVEEQLIVIREMLQYEIDRAVWHL